MIGQKLQKNTLLTLCSDRILQDVTFDRYRCARLVLDCLCVFEDSSMGRMSVAICSILAAKISTSETTVLGSTPKYMRKLLKMVRTKMESNQVDITLKFTLSALWNLTGRDLIWLFIWCRESKTLILFTNRWISRNMFYLFERGRFGTFSWSARSLSRWVYHRN